MSLVRTVEGDLPMLPMTAGWLFDPGHAIVWVIMLVFIAQRVVRDRRLSDFALIFLAATSGFWIEWFADWACYLLYNPRLPLMPWESQWFMTPYKPWAVLFGYGVFFGAGIPLCQWAIDRISAARPDWSRARAIAVFAVPTFYIFDVVVEALWAWMGWYSYTSPVSPALRFEKGSFSLVHPAILFTIWAYCFLWLIDRPVAGEPNRIERWAGIRSIGISLKGEIGRLLVWSLTFQVTLFVAFALIGGLLRVLFGPPSDLVP